MAVQKTPTTANRLRLEQAISDAMEQLPSVYKGSIMLSQELNKFPDVGEREIAEQAEALARSNGGAGARDGSVGAGAARV